MEWRYIRGYEGLYQVSDSGLVRSVPRFAKNRSGKVFLQKGRLMKQNVSPNCNYLMVDLYKNGKRTHHLTHILVARTFLGCDDKSLEVNHKDGNHFNNNIENLELVTHLQNIRHARENGLINDYGEKSANAALSDYEAFKVRKFWQMGCTQTEIAETFGVSIQTISKIVNNKSYIK